MRNLKKILAMVLALVMSLSLMAVAGAKDYTDKADINAEYQAAVDVLNGLEVFRGYEDGSFQPKGDITRAEVATIIYRIATADVTDAQAGIYTTWGKFDDVKDGAWYAGYVNYCANAGIVYGKTPAGVTPALFDPEARITGYQVLAMILRTIGYGKNGEFEGSNWAINTAAQAKQLGIIDGVTENLLGSNATREFVAQILFKTILTSQVDYSVLEGYKPNGKTLAKEKFGMEKVTGVVMANEYADLEGTKTLSTGKTRLDVDGKSYVLNNVTTDLTDIGESRTAYVRKTTQNTFDLLVDKLYDSGSNIRTENDGDGMSSNGIAKLARDNGMNVTGAKHFVNFDDSTVGKSEWRIEYQVGFDVGSDITDPDKSAQEWFEKTYKVTLDGAEAFDVDETTDTPANTRLDKIEHIKRTNDGITSYYRTYTRVIPRGNDITAADIAIMEGIFSVASDKNHASVSEVGVTGYVYAGTSQKDDEHDLSSEISWNKFQTDYLTSDATAEITSVNTGDWLKIIDNDGDGMADYVFKTVYCMEQVLSKNTRNDYFIFGYYNGSDVVESHIDAKNGTVNYLDEVEVGDVVLAALIDGKWQIELAPQETKTIHTINFREETATTTDGDVYDQTGIDLYHDMGKNILNMANNTEYTIYFDHFGHLGAYTTGSSEKHYALLTELYQNYDRNGKYLNDTETVVEIQMGEEKLDEKVVTNMTNKSGKPSSNTAADWFKGDRIGTDYLQRAINHLGLSHAQRSADVDYPATGAEFRYLDTNSRTDTNVALYSYNEEKDTVEIYPAAEYALNVEGARLYYSELDKDGNTKDPGDNFAEKVTEAEYKDRFDKANGTGAYDALGDNKWNYLKPVYAVDYIKLSISNIESNKVHYAMDEADASWNVYGLYDNYTGNFINATRNTEYYVVNRAKTGASAISYYVGYGDLPEFNKGDIRAMYAVATNTTASKDQADYWVADVIVIEATGIKNDYDSVALTYFNSFKQTGDEVKFLDALSNVTEDPDITLVPKDEGWNGQWTKYWFFGLYNTEVDTNTADKDTVTASSTERITADYNSNGIYAGTVYREISLIDYITVDRGNGNYVPVRNLNEDVPVYGIVDYSDAEKWKLYPLDVSDLMTGDEIIYVYNGNTLKYIVVANFNTDAKREGGRYDKDCDPSYEIWTKALWKDIIDDQNPQDQRAKVDLKFNLTGNDTATVTYYDEAVKDTQVKQADSANKTIQLRVSYPSQFQFTVKIADLTAMVPDTGFEFTAITPIGDDGDTWRVTAAIKDDMVNTASEDDNIKHYSVGEAYTEDAVRALIDTVYNKNIGGEDDGAVSLGEAKDAAAKLLGIVANLTVDPAAVPVDNKNLDTVIVDIVVEVKVEAYFDEHPEVDEAAYRQAVEEAVRGAVEDAVENEGSVSASDINAIVDTKVEEAVKPATPASVNVTLKTEAGIGVASAADKNGAVTVAYVQDDVYTLTADTELTVVLTITSEEELDETNPIIVTVDGAPVDAEATLSTDKKTVTVVLDLPADATKVTYEFALNIKEE